LPPYLFNFSRTVTIDVPLVRKRAPKENQTEARKKKIARQARSRVRGIMKAAINDFVRQLADFAKIVPEDCKNMFDAAVDAIFRDAEPNPAPQGDGEALGDPPVADEARFLLFHRPFGH
jgi:hypothetical protein